MDNLNSRLTSLKPNQKVSTVHLFIALLLVISLSAAGYFFYQYTQAKKAPAPNAPSVALNEETTKQVIDELADHVILPADEEPYVALVKDASVLKDQPLLVRAQNGDLIFMYVKAKRAILYRPSEKKIVDIGPINVKN